MKICSKIFVNTSTKVEKKNPKIDFGNFFTNFDYLGLRILILSQITEEFDHENRIFSAPRSQIRIFDFFLHFGIVNAVDFNFYHNRVGNLGDYSTGATTAVGQNVVF